MSGDMSFAERARKALDWMEQEKHGLGEAPSWVRDLLDRAFFLPKDRQPMRGDPWRERMVREVLASLALCGEALEVSALIPRDGRVLWDWLVSHPSREARFLSLLTDPPCEKGEQKIWLRKVLSAPVVGLLKLAWLSELQEVEEALRQGLREAPEINVAG